MNGLVQPAARTLRSQVNAPDNLTSIGSEAAVVSPTMRASAAWTAGKADAMTFPNPEQAKKLAKLLRDDLAAAGLSIPHSLALELVAHQSGAKDWNVLAAAISRPGRWMKPDISPGVPVLRVMSVETALTFYLGYLGFHLDWEHRYQPGSPLYVQVSRSKAVLHLSEHHGDGSPNGVVWFPVANVVGLHKELLDRPNAPVRPGLDAHAPGGPTFQVTDPYGNVLRFAQPPETAQQAQAHGEANSSPDSGPPNHPHKPE
jgi:catechol 2,3-dioxygenase-like lactoylglutathione lyase family enzyme